MAMFINQDFSDLFAELNAANARYLLVGGYALAVHSRPRFTKDLDIWIEPTPENAARVHAALVRFGAPLQHFSIEDLQQPGIVIQIGLPPSRVDLLTSIDGVDFDEAWPGRTMFQYGTNAIQVIGVSQLIQNKRASGRAQDLADVELLERDQHE
jgi:hypothetical protein